MKEEELIRKGFSIETIAHIKNQSREFSSTSLLINQEKT